MSDHIWVQDALALCLAATSFRLPRNGWLALALALVPVAGFGLSAAFC